MAIPGLTFRPVKDVSELPNRPSPESVSEFVEVLASTRSAEPPADVTTPATSPATESPEVADASCERERLLSPSCRFETGAPLRRSAAARPVAEASFRPTNDAKSFPDRASPVEMSTVSDLSPDGPQVL